MTPVVLNVRIPQNLIELGKTKPARFCARDNVMNRRRDARERGIHQALPKQCITIGSAAALAS